MRSVPDSRVSAWASVFNLSNSAIGAGVLSFPFAFHLAGLVGGGVLCVGVAALELLTLSIIIRQAARYHSHTYQGLVRNALGQRAADAMSCSIVLYLFGSCVAFMIIAGDTVHALLSRFLSPSNASASLIRFFLLRPTAVLVPALTIMLPLCLQSSMGALAPASTLAVVVMTCTALIIAFKALAMLFHGSSLGGGGALQAATGVLATYLTDLWSDAQKSSIAQVAAWPDSEVGKASSMQSANTQARAPSGPQLLSWQLTAFGAVPIMVFAYQCHVQAVPIFHELTPVPSLWPGSRAMVSATAAAPTPEAPEEGTCERAQTDPGAHLPDWSTPEGVEQPLLANTPASRDTSRGVPAQVHAHPARSNSLCATPVRRHAMLPTRGAEQLRLQLGRKVAGMLQVVAVASCGCSLLYLTTGVTGFLLFPRDTQSNVLNSFDPADSLMQVVRAFVGLAVALHYPINHHAARSAAYNLACRACGAPMSAHPPYSHMVAVTLVFFAATAATACAVTDLGAVFQVFGGVAGSVIIFVIPGALLVASAHQDRPSSMWPRVGPRPDMQPLSESAAVRAGVSSAEGMHNRREPSEAQHWQACVAGADVHGASSSRAGSAVPAVPTRCEGHSSTAGRTLAEVTTGGCAALGDKLRAGPLVPLVQEEAQGQEAAQAAQGKFWWWPIVADGRSTVKSVSASMVADGDIVVGSAASGNGCGTAVEDAKYSAHPFQVASEGHMPASLASGRSFVAHGTHSFEALSPAVGMVTSIKVAQQDACASGPATDRGGELGGEGMWGDVEQTAAPGHDGEGAAAPYLQECVGGCLLMVFGVCVIVLTLYTTL